MLFELGNPAGKMRMLSGDGYDYTIMQDERKEIIALRLTIKLESERLTIIKWEKEYGWRAARRFEKVDIAEEFASCSQNIDQELRSKMIVILENYPYNERSIGILANRTETVLLEKEFYSSGMMAFWSSNGLIDKSTVPLFEANSTARFYIDSKVGSKFGFKVSSNKLSGKYLLLEKDYEYEEIWQLRLGLWRSYKICNKWKWRVIPRVNFSMSSRIYVPDEKVLYATIAK